MTAASPIVLEPAAQQVADAFSKPPFLWDMAPADARKVLDDAQSGPVSKPAVDEEWITVPSPAGDARVRIIRQSVGGNMTAALTLMAKQRGDVTFVHQSMYYPVTDAAMDTASYERFATGYYLEPP